MGDGQACEQFFSSLQRTKQTYSYTTYSVEQSSYVVWPLCFYAACAIMRFKRSWYSFKYNGCPFVRRDVVKSLGNTTFLTVQS
jgi:hypothetical protein